MGASSCEGVGGGWADDEVDESEYGECDEGEDEWLGGFETVLACRFEEDAVDS